MTNFRKLRIGTALLLLAWIPLAVSFVAKISYSRKIEGLEEVMSSLEIQIQSIAESAPGTKEDRLRAMSQLGTEAAEIKAELNDTNRFADVPWFAMWAICSIAGSLFVISGARSSQDAG